MSRVRVTPAARWSCRGGLLARYLRAFRVHQAEAIRSVDAWFAQIPEGADFVSVLTLGELEKGITKLASSRRRDALERWFGDLRDRFSGRILTVDEPVALE